MAQSMELFLARWIPFSVGSMIASTEVGGIFDQLCTTRVMF